MPAAAAAGAALFVQEGDQRLVPVECGAAEPPEHLQDVSLPAAQLGGRKAVYSCSRSKSVQERRPAQSPEQSPAELSRYFLVLFSRRPPA